MGAKAVNKTIFQMPPWIHTTAVDLNELQPPRNAHGSDGTAARSSCFLSTARTGTLLAVRSRMS